MKVKAKTKPEQVSKSIAEAARELEKMALAREFNRGFQQGIKNTLAYLVVKGVIEPDQAVDAALNGINKTYTFVNDSPF